MLSIIIHHTDFNASFAVGSRKNDLSPDDEDEDGESVSADDDEDGEGGGGDNYRDGNEVDDVRRKSSSSSGGSKVTVNPAPLAM